jgi:nucleotide-binding universal stress UspA family protein
MADLLERVILPVAHVEDAEETARAARTHLTDSDAVVLVHVVEKAGGAPDKASVEQRENEAEEMFDAAERLLDRPVERDLRYGTDTVDAIFAAADDADATAIVVSTRGGSRIVQLLTGDVALKLVTENDRPVVVLPHGEDGVTDASGESGATATNDDTDDAEATE